MSKIFHPLLALIASATDRELAKYIDYLKAENKILRARIPGQIHTRPAERERLLKLGKVIGRGIEELMTIVSPATFYRWVRDEKTSKPKAKNPKGGQRKPRDVRALVIEIAKTTGFGYSRIIGELRKLGIRKISRQTVRNILKEEGIQPGPDRANDNWDNFVQRHANTLWAVDFFSVKTVTTRGLRDMYVMVWLCMSTREVIVSESTRHPNSAWVEKQADWFVDQTANREEQPSIVMHDKDTKFTKEFTDKLKSRGVRTNSLPKASPNLNGRCERIIGTPKVRLYLLNDDCLLAVEAAFSGDQFRSIATKSTAACLPVAVGGNFDPPVDRVPQLGNKLGDVDARIHRQCVVCWWRHLLLLPDPGPSTSEFRGPQSRLGDVVEASWLNYKTETGTVSWLDWYNSLAKPSWTLRFRRLRRPYTPLQSPTVLPRKRHLPSWEA